MSDVTLLDASKDDVPGEHLVDVVIIGSGSGGATAAWELALAGKQVLVLEEGGDFTGRQLTQRDSQMYDQLYMDRGGRSTVDLGITVQQGRVLGGGGVINAADVVPISDEVLHHWHTAFGLTDVTPQSMSLYRDAALADLSANRPSDAELNANNRLLRDGATSLGLTGEVMLHNRVGCAGLGTCLIGCPLNAKRNPRFVAIPAASKAGARFITRARAVRIEGGTSEVKTVHVRTLDAKGYHEQKSFIVRARLVILAANAVASAQLLLKSGLGNAHVGRHLMLQPQHPITALFQEPVNSFRGIPQAWALTHYETKATEQKGWWGFRVEPVFGTPGIVASLLPRVGLPAKELMQRYPNLAAALLLTPDEPVGQVTVEKSGRLRVAYTLTEEHKARLRQAITVAARIYLAAGATEVLVPSIPAVVIRSEAQLGLVDDVTFRPASSPFLSAHQMGTVRMSPNEADGAADPDGQVYGTKGVYVFDTSGFPSSASSHTMAPTITWARYLTARLLARA